MSWFIDADRRLGTSHAANGSVCQDNYCHLSKEHWHAICISDGAGSAKFSEISSRYISEHFCQSLLVLADLIEERGPGSWINDYIIGQVLELRRGLKEYTNTSELDDYHCTLVSILVSKSAAIAVHIGDGAIIAGQWDPTSKARCALNENVVASLPENGDYKNETFFITEPHWLKHLRITVLGKIDWFVMGTDGGIDVLSDRQRLDGPLIADIINYTSPSSDEAGALTQLIHSDIAVEKTSDDITLAIGWLQPADKKEFFWKDAPSKDIYLDPAVGVRNSKPPASDDQATEVDKSQDQSIRDSFLETANRRSSVILIILAVVVFLTSVLYWREGSDGVDVSIDTDDAASGGPLAHGAPERESSNESNTVDKQVDDVDVASENLTEEQEQNSQEAEGEPKGLTPDEPAERQAVDEEPPVTTLENSPHTEAD